MVSKPSIVAAGFGIVAALRHAAEVGSVEEEVLVAPMGGNVVHDVCGRGVGFGAERATRITVFFATAERFFGEDLRPEGTPSRA